MWTCVKVTIVISGFEPASAPAPSVPAWQGRSIGTTKLRLVEFSAFLEQQRDPDSVSMPRGVWLVGSASIPAHFFILWSVTSGPLFPYTCVKCPVWKQTWNSQVALLHPGRMLLADSSSFKGGCLLLLGPQASGNTRLCLIKFNNR